jgi:hypothetical protein
MSASAPPSALRLEAADGLRLAHGADGAWRLSWGAADWLGPLGLRIEHAGRTTRVPGLPDPVRRFAGEDDLGRFRGVELSWEGLPLPVRRSVRAYADRPVLVFRLEAAADLGDLATGDFARPCVSWPWWQLQLRRPGGVPEGTSAFGHQFTEFAFPTFAGPGLDDFFLFPHRPAVLAPLWLNAPGASLMLAPLDAFHDQAMAPPRDPEDGLRCGWHGDLARAARGHASELALWAGPGPRAVLEDWAGFLRRRHGTRRPSRHADATVARLSYWTDNGAAYWYRTEPDADVGGTLERVATSLRRQEIPACAFELDSWFYPHEISRSVNPDGQEHVPPTGMLAWEARADVLPEGVRALRRRIGDAPLILHTRHFSSRSPYWRDHDAWTDGDRAHPVGPDLFRRLLGQAADWGAITVEQDWLVEMFLGVRGLREEPGRARAWQESFDAAAAEHGLSLLWCMATPADFFQTLTLPTVVSIRTSGDYRYLAGNAAHWTRFLYTNALARALGLLPFKDVFLTNPKGSGWDGDEHAEAEALLSALSAGPVGIGDRSGRSDPGIVMRTCRADGVLVKPDVPIAALERCFRRDVWFHPEPLVAEAHSIHPAGRWTYLASFNAWRGRTPLRFELALADLGALAPTAPVLALDWRSGRTDRLEPDARIPLELAPDAWDYRVLCPLLEGEIGVFGDVVLYATAGDRRLRDIRSQGGTLRFDVLGAPGERACVEGWSAREPADVDVDGDADFRWSRDPEDGRWRLRTVLGDRGWVGVKIRP